jgi:hypothetical protein
MYYPIAHPELVSALANLTNGDEQLVLDFANEWGHLGSAEPGSPDWPSGADPLPWIWAHAETIRRVLQLINLIANGSGSKLEDYLDSIAMPYRPVIENSRYTRYEIVPDRYLEGLVEYLDTQVLDIWEPTPKSPLPQKSPQEVGREIVTEVINHHLAGVGTGLSYLYGNGDGFERNWSFSNLLTAVYWHISNAATGTTQYRQCVGCGRFFDLKHGLRRYCPPDYGGESLCSLKARQTKWRNK